MKMKRHKVCVISVVLGLMIFACSEAFADLAAIETAIMQKDFKSALKQAQQYMDQKDEKDNNFYQAQYYLAVSCLNLKDYANARSNFREVVQANPNPLLHDRAYLGMFNSYFLQGDYEQALDMTNRMLKASPRSEFLSLIHLKKARAYMKLTRWSKARKHLHIIVKSYPKSLESFTAERLLREKQYFTVQVGAFMERAKAEKLVRELKAHDEYAYIVETKDRADITFYRVRVGRLAKLKEAERLRKKLADQGYPALVYP